MQERIRPLADEGSLRSEDYQAVHEVGIPKGLEDEASEHGLAGAGGGGYRRCPVRHDPRDDRVECFELPLPWRLSRVCRIGPSLLVVAASAPRFEVLLDLRAAVRMGAEMSDVKGLWGDLAPTAVFAAAA
jgi:hypothetical protein